MTTFIIVFIMLMLAGAAMAIGVIFGRNQGQLRWSRRGRR